MPEERLRAPQSLRLSIENNDDLRVSWSAPSNAGSRPSVGRYEIRITGGGHVRPADEQFQDSVRRKFCQVICCGGVSCKPDVELEISVRQSPPQTSKAIRHVREPLPERLQTIDF